MKEAARNLEFERAALLRDRIVELRRAQEETSVGAGLVLPNRPGRR